MQHLTTVKVPAYEKQVVDKTTCDFCGEEIKPERYSFDQVKLERNEGDVFPEGGSGEKTVFDCCPSCWGSKVEPALRALGGKPRVERWDI